MDMTPSDGTYLDVLAAAIASEVAPGNVPEGSRSLFRTYAVLLLAVGSEITDADVHNAWVGWMTEREPAHPALRPYDELDDETAEMDRPYAEAIRRVASRCPEGSMTNDERIIDVLLPGGPPPEERRAEFLELYKLMVASSEALVSRRQAVNTFFLTINGALLTAVGLVARLDGRPHLRAIPVVAIAIAGVVMAYAWWSLLRSFGQLNTGKFAIINRMERWLSASIYGTEWEALDRGENPNVYRSFTSREVFIPIVALAIYGFVACAATLVAVGVLVPA